MHPLAILLVGVTIVLVTILWLRLNAFFGLLLAAIAVSCLTPGELADKMPRVAVALGKTVGDIGITIALAAVVGGALVASGAARDYARGPDAELLHAEHERRPASERQSSLCRRDGVHFVVVQRQVNASRDRFKR